MIWFDIKALEKKISNNELTDKDGFNYVLAFIILCTIGVSISANNSNGYLKLSECILSVLINVWGMKTLYEVNNEIDGNDFFKRFFSISWVIGMRMFVVSLIFGLILGLAIAIASIANGGNRTEANIITDIFLSIFMTMINLISYLLIINSFRKLKTIKN